MTVVSWQTLRIGLGGSVSSERKKPLWKKLSRLITTKVLMTWNWWEKNCIYLEKISGKSHAGNPTCSKDILILIMHSFFCCRLFYVDFTHAFRNVQHLVSKYIVNNIALKKIVTLQTLIMKYQCFTRLLTCITTTILYSWDARINFSLTL